VTMPKPMTEAIGNTDRIRARPCANTGGAWDATLHLCNLWRLVSVRHDARLAYDARAALLALRKKARDAPTARTPGCLGGPRKAKVMSLRRGGRRWKPASRFRLSV
jgi:hypothetical protein